METSGSFDTPVSYKEPLLFSLIQQVPVSTLFLLILDGGHMSVILTGALLGFWLGVALIVIRRQQFPTRQDILFIRWGFLPALLVSFAFGVFCLSGMSSKVL